LKIQNKRFVYLISPTKIPDNTFFKSLELVFKSKKVSFFQLRLKNEKLSKKILFSKKIIKICRKYNVKFLVNDDPILALKVNADGCHLGQKDMSILRAKKILKDKSFFKKVEKIIHPLVRKEMTNFIKKHKNKKFTFFDGATNIKYREVKFELQKKFIDARSLF